MGARRRPAERGHRPRAGVRFVMGWCRACGDAFVLDRETEGSWARARTCSDYCRARLGNRGRNATNCHHCELVDSYHELRESQIRQYDVACRDEDLRPVTWREFLTGYRAPEPGPAGEAPDEAWDEADDEAWLAAWAPTCTAV